MRSIYDEVMADLAASELSKAEIAAGSGVPLSTVKRIASRATRDPSVHAIEDLYRFFRSKKRAGRRSSLRSA